MFSLKEEDIPRPYKKSMEAGPVHRAFVYGYRVCRDKFLAPVEETGMRRCPFCENDYIKVEVKTYMRNDSLFAEASGVCGVCYCKGPTVLSDFTGRVKEEANAKITDDAKSLWNEMHQSGD